MPPGGYPVRMLVRVRRLGAAVLLSATSLCGVAWTPSAIADEELQARATAVIKDVAPARLTPDTKKFTISGTVTNDGEMPLENVQVLPRWSLDPLQSRDEIPLVAENPDFRGGIRYADPFPVYFADDLEPGESAEFILPFDSEDLDDPRWFAATGVYAIGVDVRAGPTDSRPTLDTKRTVITWVSNEIKLPDVPVAMLWPVTGAPALMPDGALFDDSLGDELGGNDRLGVIVNSADASDAPLSWMVDPEVLTTVDVMADGYDVRTDGRTEEGAHSSRAQTWRAAFDSATTDAEVTFLPASRPDLEAIGAVDPDLAVDLAANAVAESQDVARESTGDQSIGVAWLEQRTADPGTIATLAGAGVETVVLPSTALELPDETQTSLETGSGTITVIAVDTALSSTLLADDVPGTDVRQRWIAETTMVALDAFAHGEQNATPLVVAPPQDWSPDSSAANAALDLWTNTPGVMPIALGDIPAPDEPVQNELVAHKAGEVLPERNVAEVEALRTETESYLSLLDDPLESREQLDDAILRGASAAWRIDPKAGRAYTSLISQEVLDGLRGVRVVVRDSVTLTSSSGEFPLTIENSLDQTVIVNLQVTSSNSDRLKIDDIPQQVVQPGSKVTVAVAAEATANGKVPVAVQLRSAGGNRVGPEKQTIVNATEYGTIGWVIVAAAGALLSAGLARRALRGRTQGRNGDSLNKSADEPAMHEEVQRSRPSAIAQ